MANGPNDMARETNGVADGPNGMARETNDMADEPNEAAFVTDGDYGVAPEGVVVTILVPEDREAFTLGPEAEAALVAAIEEADRGELLSEEEFWREWRRG
jgi:hypothetical protein